MLINICKTNFTAMCLREKNNYIFNYISIKRKTRLSQIFKC